MAFNSMYDADVGFGHTFTASFLLALAACHFGAEARAQSLHPHCQEYSRLCEQAGEPYCQQYQTHCAAGGQTGASGRFTVDTGELRMGIGVGGFFGSFAEGAMPVYLLLGPKIERGMAESESIRGLQLIPEIGLDVQFPFSVLSDGDVRFSPLNGLIGLRVLQGFGRVSLGGAAHLLLGGIYLTLDDEGESDVWRFTSGLRAALDIDFFNGGIGFELSYTWATEFQDVQLHSLTFSFFIDGIHLAQAFAAWTRG